MSRPLRIKGFSYLGAYRYFITFCCFDRAPVFTDIRLGESVAWQFRRTCRRKKFAILAYCLMPDHAHLLVEGVDAASNLTAMVKSAKQSSGQSFARYIIENPVRAGLVRSPLDYPLSGSDRWTIPELIDSLW